jgi:hypothetical protein
MRASPPIAIAPGSGTAWRVALLAVVAATLGVLLAWASVMADVLSLPVRGVVLGAAALAGAAVVRLAMRQPPRSLRFTGVRWELEVGPAGEALAGEARVALDLGGWMLVRFEPDHARRAPTRWVPLARAGRSSDWHALRCCLYAPRPAPPSA